MPSRARCSLRISRAIPRRWQTGSVGGERRNDANRASQTTLIATARYSVLSIVNPDWQKSRLLPEPSCLRARRHAWLTRRLVCVKTIGVAHDRTTHHTAFLSSRPRPRVDNTQERHLCRPLTDVAAPAKTHDTHTHSIQHLRNPKHHAASGSSIAKSVANDDAFLLAARSTIDALSA